MVDPKKHRERCSKCNALVTPDVLDRTADGKGQRLQYNCGCWHFWCATVIITRARPQRWRKVMERQKVLARRNSRKTPPTSK
jgi:hypothetical protein